MQYRINGFEQIKSFYSLVFNDPGFYRPTHISLYLFLVNQNNRSNWVEWFKCPYDLAMQGACIGSKSTYYKTLKDLETKKIIKYIPGENNYKSPLISLIKLYKSEPQTEPLSVPLSEQVSEPQTEPLSVQLTGNIYKLITNNIKLINSNEKEFILLIKKFVTGQNGLTKIPTEQEFLEYASRNKPNVDIQEVKLKYRAWIENDWKDGKGNAIKKWTSKLLQTLPYIKETKLSHRTDEEITAEKIALAESQSDL